MGIKTKLKTRRKSRKCLNGSFLIFLELPRLPSQIGLSILKEAKIDACKVTEIYHNENQNKSCITMTVRRAHYEDENKSPDWPGSWIIEEDYAQADPEGGPLI